MSYVLTQSALVLIVLAGTYLCTQLLKDVYGITINRFWVLFGLVMFAQLPVAVIYAKTEIRNPNPVEGWALAAAFVTVTMVFDVLLVGELSSLMQSLMGGAQAGAGHTQMIGYAACVVLLGVIVVAFIVKTLFGLAVRNNLGQSVDADTKSRTLAVLPGVKLKGKKEYFSRPKCKQNVADQYRHALIAANVGLFGLSMVFFGPEFLSVLKLSIPLSIMFSIVCVANNLAKTNTKVSMSERCLSISVQVMPLTVTSLLLLAASELFTGYVAQGHADITPFAYAKLLVLQTLKAEADFVQMLVFLGVIFAISLAANTLLLFVFAKLIRPMVKSTLRPTRSENSGEVADFEQAKEALKAASGVLLRPADLRKTRSQRKATTQRPQRPLPPLRLATPIRLAA